VGFGVGGWGARGGEKQGQKLLSSLLAVRADMSTAGRKARVKERAAGSGSNLAAGGSIPATGERRKSVWCDLRAAVTMGVRVVSQRAGGVWDSRGGWGGGCRDSFVHYLAPADVATMPTGGGVALCVRCFVQDDDFDWEGGRGGSLYRHCVFQNLAPILIMLTTSAVVLLVLFVRMMSLTGRVTGPWRPQWRTWSYMRCTCEVRTQQQLLRLLVFCLICLKHGVSMSAMLKE
jgi:hypothetical protein